MLHLIAKPPNEQPVVCIVAYVFIKTHNPLKKKKQQNGPGPPQPFQHPGQLQTPPQRLNPVWFILPPRVTELEREIKPLRCSHITCVLTCLQVLTSQSARGSRDSVSWPTWKSGDQDDASEAVRICRSRWRQTAMLLKDGGRAHHIGYTSTRNSHAQSAHASTEPARAQ